MSPFSMILSACHKALAGDISVFPA